MFTPLLGQYFVDSSASLLSLL